MVVVVFFLFFHIKIDVCFIGFSVLDELLFTWKFICGRWFLTEKSDDICWNWVGSTTTWVSFFALYSSLMILQSLNKWEVIRRCSQRSSCKLKCERLPLCTEFFCLTWTCPTWINTYISKRYIFSPPFRKKLFWKKVPNYPRCSMYAIFTYIHLP